MRLLAAATCQHLQHLQPLRNTPQQPLGSIYVSAYVSACYCIFVRMLLYMCPHATIYVFVYGTTSATHLDIEVMSMRVRMLLYICPHAPVYVSACYYICVRMPLYL